MWLQTGHKTTHSFLAHRFATLNNRSSWASALLDNQPKAAALSIDLYSIGNKSKCYKFLLRWLGLGILRTVLLVTVSASVLNACPHYDSASGSGAGGAMNTSFTAS